ncbi:MAG: DUF3037 domain-containing protein [Candidatus Acidiferrales bacterium]
MANEKLSTFTYRVLRYAPNLVRDEWVNIGVLLFDVSRGRLHSRFVEEPAELARVRRLHPAADENFLRALPADFDAQVAAAPEASAFVEKMDQTLSNLIQLSPQKAVLAEDFDAELERLYREQVAPPRYRERAGLFESTRAFIRQKLSDVFRRHRILSRLEKAVRVEEFTEAGDPLRIDYAYRSNGTRGYVHAVALARDPAQAKVLAYTAECIRARQPESEFAAITESAPQLENPRHRFVASLLTTQHIEIVPLAQAEQFAVRLRTRLR